MTGASGLIGSALLPAPVVVDSNEGITTTTNNFYGGSDVGLRRGFAEMWRVLAWLRRRRFAVVFDLQGSLRSRLMTRCSGARQRIGASGLDQLGEGVLHEWEATGLLGNVAGDPSR